MKVAIVGAGAAGTAAAWSARRAGATVAVFFDRAGASSLYSGALDLLPWEEGRPDAPLDSEVIAFTTAMEAWTVGTRGARIATFDGVLRPARGIDSTLLDVAPLAGQRVGVVETAVSAWDARGLARSLSEAPWAVATHTRFEVVAVPGILEKEETEASWYDIAALHDSSERTARLAECLERTASNVDAWLLGPWLGTAPGASERLSGIVGKPCGETTSPAGGPAGARFDASRDALLSSFGVSMRSGPIDSIARRGQRFLPIGRTPDLTARDTGFDAIVLATGGVAAGGVVLEMGEAGGPSRFCAGISSGVLLGLDGRLIDHASSTHGVDLVALGMGALERVGILAKGEAAVGSPDIFVAGDCVADRPRCVLSAVRSGIAAARGLMATRR